MEYKWNTPAISWLQIFRHAHPSAGFPGSTAGKESTHNAGDPSLIPGSGRLPGDGICYPVQYSWFPWWLTKYRIRLQCGRRRFDPWVGKISWRRAWQHILVFLPGESPWTEEPSELQSMGSQRVGHDWGTKHAAYPSTVCTQSCLTFCDPLDCNPPGSSVYEILQVRILEWIPISFSLGSSPPRDLLSPSLARGFFTTEPSGKSDISITRCRNLFGRSSSCSVSLITLNGRASELMKYL